MSPERLQQLERDLALEGLHVLRAADHRALLLSLARLAQFERLTVTAAERDPKLATVIEGIRRRQQPVGGTVREIALADILDATMLLNRDLHALLDRQTWIRPSLLQTACRAFVGVLVEE